MDALDAMRAAAAIMVGSLLEAAPPEQRAWLEDWVAKQADVFPGADVIQRASAEILREVDAYNAAATTHYQESANPSPEADA